MSSYDKDPFYLRYSISLSLVSHPTCLHDSQILVRFCSPFRSVSHLSAHPTTQTHYYRSQKNNSTGHSGKHGHEFLEFEYSHGRLRYANNSNYRNDSLIRKESAFHPIQLLSPFTLTLTQRCRVPFLLLLLRSCHPPCVPVPIIRPSHQCGSVPSS